MLYVKIDTTLSDPFFTPSLILAHVPPPPPLNLSKTNKLEEKKGKIFMWLLNQHLISHVLEVIVIFEYS